MPSPPEIPAPPRSGLITAGLIVGSLLSLSPLVGMAGTVIGMVKSFQALGTSGAGDTGQLSVGIGEVLVSTAVGFVLFIPGVVILTLSIIHYRRAKKRIAATQSPPP
jgi:biopolymer transport protein ExbB/TolQ